MAAVVVLSQVTSNDSLGWFLYTSAALVITIVVAARGLERAVTRAIASSISTERWAVARRPGFRCAGETAAIGAFVGLGVAMSAPGGTAAWMVLGVSAWFSMECARQFLAEILRGVPAPWLSQLVGFPVRNLVFLVAVAVTWAADGKFSLGSLLLTQVIINSLQLAVGLQLVARRSRRMPKGALPLSDLRASGWAMWAASVVRQVLNQGDIVLAGLILGQDPAFAAYAFAARMVTGLGNASVVTNNAVFPLAAEQTTLSAEDRRIRDVRVLRLAGLVASLPAAVVVAAVIVLALTGLVDQIDPLLGKATPFFVILGLGQVLNTTSSNFASYVMARGEERAIRRIHYVIGAVVLPLEVVSASLGSLYALALVSGIGGAAPGIWSELVSRRIYGVGLRGRV